MNETDNSDDSDEEQIEIPEHIIDTDNPWLAERKEFTDFMTGYSNFVQNNSDSINKNDLNEKSKFNNENNELKELVENNSKIEEQKNDKMVKPIKQVIKKNSKVKYITIQDLSRLTDEESDIEILKIVDPQKEQVNFSMDIPKSKTNLNVKEKNTNSSCDSSIPLNKKSSNIEIIKTIAGTWLVSSDDVNNINTKKKKVHRDVENAFKTVEIELKHKISEKLENLNKVKDVQSSKTSIKKRKCQDAKSDYLKMNKKRTKAEFNEPLYEENKTYNETNGSNIEISHGSIIKIKDKSKKEVQNIDPTVFLQVAQTSLETEAMTQVEDCLDDKEEENEQDKLIAEAFADDDIINEFKYL